MAGTDEFTAAQKFARRLPKLQRQRGPNANLEATRRRVLDFIGKFPTLSNRQISALLGVSRDTIADVRFKPESLIRLGFSRNDLQHISNFIGNAKFVEAYNKLTGGRFYEDHPAARFEEKGTLSVAVDNGTASYKVDQSHTLPRPITLPTRPFAFAA